MDETIGAVVVDDAGVAALEVVDDAVDGLLVAGDDARAEQDGVARIDLGELVVVDRSAGERGHGLALRAGDEDTGSCWRGSLDLAGMDDESLWRVDVAEVLSDLRAVVDGAADDATLRPCSWASSMAMRMRWMEDEKQQKKSFFLAARRSRRGADDGALGGRVAGTIDVGGVLEQHEHALLAEFGEGVEVEGLGVGRGEVDLEVAGVDDQADRSVDGEGHAVHQRVRDADGHDGEGPESEAVSGKDFDQFGIVEQAMLFELALDSARVNSVP